MVEQNEMLVKIRDHFVRCVCNVHCNECRIRFRCFTSLYLEMDDVPNTGFTCMERVDINEWRVGRAV